MNNELEVSNQKSVQVNQEDLLMTKALETGNIEVLERFIALREREEQRQAKLAYNENFALMQAEFEAVHRTKSGHNYKYAPIETLQKAYAPAIAKYGFSYRWNEETIPTGKRCTMVISGHGHSESNTFDIPPISGTNMMNPIQVMGTMSSYGRRYTFIAGFGVIIDDEDNDGATLEKKYIGIQKEFDSCTTMDELTKVWNRYYPQLRNDKNSCFWICHAKDDTALRIKNSAPVIKQAEPTTEPVMKQAEPMQDDIESPKEHTLDDKLDVIDAIVALRDKFWEQIGANVNATYAIQQVMADINGSSYEQIKKVHDKLCKFVDSLPK